VPVFVELGRHLFTQSMNQTRHRFFAVVRRRRLQFVVERLDDALLVRQSLFEVGHSLVMYVGVERDLRQQLRLTIFGVETQSTLALTPTPTTVTETFQSVGNSSLRQ